MTPRLKPACLFLMAGSPRSAALRWPEPESDKATATAKGRSPSAQDRAAKCQLRPPALSWLSHGAHASTPLSAPLRSLSLSRTQGTRACDACAPCRAGCGRFTHRTRPPHRREASLQRCKTVLRGSSCGLQHRRSFKWLARQRATALAVHGEEAQHAFLRRARAVPGWL